MNLKHCVIMSDDVFNTIKVIVHDTHIDANKLKDAYPSYLSGKLVGRLEELKSLLEVAED